MARRPDPAKRQHWQQLLDRQRHSGLTVRAFCDSAGVSQAAFYAWRRRLHTRPAARPSAAPTFVPVRVLPDGPTDGPAAPLEVVLANGLRLRVSPGFDPATLQQLVRALGGPAC